MSSNSGGGPGYLSGGPGPAGGDRYSSSRHSSSASGSGQTKQQQQQQSRNEPANQRYSNLIYDSEVFLTKLREFKPQSLGCLEARRKSSSTLIFPNPQQACMGSPKCPRYPHDIKPTPGYWIECHGPGPLPLTASGQAKTGDHQQQQQQQQQQIKSSPGLDQEHHHHHHQLGAEQPQPGGVVKPDELKLIFDCASRSSGASSGLSSHSHSHSHHQQQQQQQLHHHHHMPTTPTAEKILTRHHYKELGYSQDEDDYDIAVTGRRQSITDQIDFDSPSHEREFGSGHHHHHHDHQGEQPIVGLAATLKHVGNASSSPEMMQTHTTDGNHHQSESYSQQKSTTFSSSRGGGGGDQQTTTTTTTTRATAASPDTPSRQTNSTVVSANEMRKRLNKRTITRDDIDLHKPRRGTPNITITEPSFNQSIIAYQSSNVSRKVQQRPAPTRQGSQQGVVVVASSNEREFKARTESIEGEQVLNSSKPFDGCSSSGGEVFVLDDDDDDVDYDRDLALRRKESYEQMTGEATYGGEQQASFSGGGGGESAGALDFRPYRQQHRPSVIREDSDFEGSEQQATCQQQQQQQEHRSEFYCGLATTTFQKKPYQQLQAGATTTATATATATATTTTTQATSFDQFKDGSLELISFEEENYEKHYYGREHWNYFTNDELLGPVMLSLKQEVNNQRDHFHVLLRTVSYTLHGTIPASTICADRYDREAIVRELSEIAKLKPPLMLGQLPSTPDELLKLDHIFIKTELKVGVIYIKEGQAESEEAILGNKEESPLFTEFLDLLGDRIILKGFDRYKGGLDTVHNLTGTESVYTMWRNIEIMFHVSTMLPHEENDPQKLQKKRHIGNDIVCVAFIESDDTLFWPGCIKSYFLHTFITIRTSPKPLKEGEKRKYSVSCVCRNEVQYAFKPYLIEQDEFFKSDYFREWLLVKIVNGERASYSAPKFARMQDRTRSQLLEDIITNLANHLVTGQIPKPYRRGSWRPLGHTRASSPLEDSMKDYFEDYDQLAKDFCNAFCGPSRSMLCDVVFRVKDKDGTYKLVHGVRAIMAIRSRTFLEMLYGFVPPGTASSSLQNQTNLRAIEMKALSGESSSSTGGGGGGGTGGTREMEQTKTLLAKRGSVGADSGKKIGEKERRQSMLPNLSKSITQKPNYLTVPNTSSGGGGAGGGGGSGTGGMIKNAFNRLVSGNWSGWSGNIKGYKGEPMHIKVDQNKTKVDLNSLAICKEIAKIDADKLSQREFEIKEFDYETFQQTIEYIHNGQCKLSYETIPGLICAAEHYDLPDLLHACFHHANTHMKLSAAPKMMNALYQNSCFYVTAMQLLDSIYEYIDPHGNDFFSKPEYLELYESVFTTLLSRKTLQVGELKKFQAMHGWAKQQVANKQQQKQLLQKQQSLELQQQQQQQQQQHEKSETIEKEQQQQQVSASSAAEMEADYRNLMSRLNKEVNIKLDKISNEDLVKIVLPTKVFSNDKIFDVMADESRNEY